MSDSTPYVPPKVWTWNKANGGQFANINRPISGATKEQALPVGRHPMQLYSLATPNGVKVTVMLEELLALGHTGAEYDAWLIRINTDAAYDCGKPFGEIWKFGWAGMKDKWPVAYKVAKAYQIDTNELNAMSGQIDLDGKTIEEVAAAWVAANEAKWKAWAQ